MGHPTWATLQGRSRFDTCWILILYRPNSEQNRDRITRPNVSASMSLDETSAFLLSKGCLPRLFALSIGTGALIYDLKSDHQLIGERVQLRPHGKTRLAKRSKDPWQRVRPEHPSNQGVPQTHGAPTSRLGIHKTLSTKAAAGQEWIGLPPCEPDVIVFPRLRRLLGGNMVFLAQYKGLGGPRIGNTTTDPYIVPVAISVPTEGRTFSHSRESHQQICFLAVPPAQETV